MGLVLLLHVPHMCSCFPVCSKNAVMNVPELEAKVKEATNR